MKHVLLARVHACDARGDNLSQPVSTAQHSALSHLCVSSRAREIDIALDQVNRVVCARLEANTWSLKGCACLCVTQG